MTYKIIFSSTLLCLIGAKVASACNKTAECGDECGKINYCDTVGSKAVNCPSSHPYCVTGPTSDYCSTALDLSRPVCEKYANKKMYFCTSEGYFPDPEDCNKYYICSNRIDGELIATPYSCPLYHIFNYNRNKECYYYVNPPVAACPNVTCDFGVTTYAIQFPRDPQYYYFCLPNPLNPSNLLFPLMFKCDDGFIFNGKKCVYNCPREGRFPIPRNSTGYYECNYIINRYVARTENCPEGYQFNPSLGFCQDMQ